jgi:hypothetical protein
MRRSLEPTGFIPGKPVSYGSKALQREVTLSPETVIDVAVNANLYLFSLAAFFENAEFEFYEAVGQRNLSGFIGEVFVKSFEKVVDGYSGNPHADGRPDILDLTTDEAEAHFERDCFAGGASGPVPLRGLLAPFKYGGLEVKASIGSPVAKYKDRLAEDFGVGGFLVGMPRIDYLDSITYWGHHASCENLIGLYYDYVPELDSAPQVLLVMHSELEAAVDWNRVSVGRSTSKKTSNTSLTKTGKEKLYRNVVAVVDDKRYLSRLRDRGVGVPTAATSSP